MGSHPWGYAPQLEDDDDDNDDDNYDDNDDGENWKAVKIFVSMGELYHILYVLQGCQQGLKNTTQSKFPQNYR